MIKKGQLLKVKRKPPIMRVLAVRNSHIVIGEAYPHTTDTQTLLTHKEYKLKYAKTSLTALRFKQLLLLPLTIIKAIRRWFKDCKEQRKIKKEESCG